MQPVHFRAMGPRLDPQDLVPYTKFSRFLWEAGVKWVPQTVFGNKNVFEVLKWRGLRGLAGRGELEGRGAAGLRALRAGRGEVARAVRVQAEGADLAAERTGRGSRREVLRS